MQSFAPAHLAEMALMGEVDVLEEHLVGVQILVCMTRQAALVGHLGAGPGGGDAKPVLTRTQDNAQRYSE